MQSRSLLQLLANQQVSFSNTPLITPDTCNSFISAWVYSNPGKTAAWMLNRSVYSLTCVVASTEGVKFRVLCEEPGTALHLLMEVKACLSALPVQNLGPCSSWVALRLDVFPSPDQPSRVQLRAPDLPHPHLQLLPQRLLGSSGQEAVCRGADLPLEAQNHQEWLRGATEEEERKGNDWICGETQSTGELLRV